MRINPAIRRTAPPALTVTLATLVALAGSRGPTTLASLIHAGWAAAIALLLAATAQRAEERNRGIWRALAWHVALVALGIAVEKAVGLATGEQALPVIVNVFRLAAVAPLVVALIRIAARSGARPQVVFIDAAAVAIVAGLSVFHLLIAGPAGLGDTTWPTMGAPAGDVLVIGALAALVFARTRMTAATALVTAYAATGVGLDLLSVWAAADPQSPAWLASATENGLMLALSFLALASLMRSDPEADRRDDEVDSVPPLTLLGIATIMAPVLAVVLAVAERRLWTPVLVGAALGVSILVMIRLTGLVRRLEFERQRLSATEAHLAHQASHDMLTDLPNRSLFTARLAVEVARAEDEHRELALLFVDLDDFKLVNDTLGHGAGDDLLRCVAARIRAEVGDGDVVGRVGGDEFVIVSARITDRRGASRFADTILAAICRPVQVNGQMIEPAASIGVALRGAVTEPQTLLANADLALYEAKRAGRSRARMFDQTMRHAATERAGIEIGLRRAVGVGEIGVEYQPRVDLETGRIASMEALARWPMRPDIAVGRFIEVAETTGIVEQLGRDILDRACNDIMRLNRGGRDAPIGLSVNVSMRQLMQHDLVDVVGEAISHHRLPRDLLSLEITETFVAREPEFAAHTLHELRQLGVRIEVDDFGVGHTSFRSLSALPIDGIKIDKSLVDGLRTHEATEPIIAAIVAMSQALGLQTTVEGIENAGDLEIIRRLGCNLGQGYLFSRPVPFETADRLVATWPGLCPVAADLALRRRSARP